MSGKFLLSIEIPTAFNNIRSTSNLNYLNLTCNGTAKQIVIADANITDINTMINVLNAASSLLYPSDAILFSLVNNKIRISSVNFTTIVVQNTNLSYICGFCTLTNTSVSNSITGASPFLLAFDTFLTMQISNVNSVGSNFNGQPITFKITLGGSALNYISYLGANNSFSQYATPNVSVIDKISVNFRDRFGYSISNNQIDYSFSLGFMY